MKIVFLGLASTYTPGLTYQDNYLCTQTLADGHAVTYLSNPEKFVNGEIVETGAEDTVLPDGLHLIRLPYVKLGLNIVTKKFRAFRGVYDILEREKPDLIFCHNLQYWSVRDVVRYKKDHPAVKFYADTHTDYNNSGTNWLSLHVLHRIFYRHLVRLVLPYLDRYFYVADECRQFSHEVYGIPNEKMEFYPLGGTLLSDGEYAAIRAKRRAELGLGENDRLYIHSGKLDALKRTDELLRAFSAVDDPHAVLAVIGSIPREREAVLLPLIAADKRIRYLGWKSGEELQEYLCAADLYCQPGKVSAIMQNAVCCRCPVMLYPHPDYTEGYDYGNILWEKDEADMSRVFRQLAAGEIDLAALGRGSVRCAEELLDYRALAARLYR